MIQANKLETELQESIQRFADKHWNGALDVEQVTTALAELAAAYLCEIPQPIEREQRLSRFVRKVARDTQANVQMIGERNDANA
jgi:hypothetical protein